MTALVVESVLRSIVLAAMVWAGIKLLRVHHVLAQKIAWGLVLLVSFAMPAVIRWQSSHPGTALVVPVKRTAAFRALRKRAAAIRIEPLPANNTEILGATTLSAVPVVALELSSPASSRTAFRTMIRTWHAADLLRYLLPTYLIVTGALLLRLLVGLAMAMRIWDRAERASPLVEPRANVRISASIQSPVTIGSGIVLPASYIEWDRAKLRLVLAHERSHVRQGDFYLQLLASFYAALVWFSPLGWWLKHRLADLGEALSDHAALEETDDNSSYAEVLLQFAALPRHGFAGTTAGVGMARSSNIQRRIERILNERIFRSAFLSGRRHAVTAALLVPAGLVLATSLLHVQAAERAKAKTIAALTPPQNAKTWRPFKAAPAPHAVLTASAQTSPSQAAWPAPAAPAASAASWTAPPAAWVPPAPWAAPGLAALTRARLARLTAMVQAAPAAPAAARTISSMPAPPALTLAAPVPPSVILASNQASIVAPQEMGDDQDDDDGSHFAVIDRDKGFSYSHNASWGKGGKADRIAKNIQGSFIWFERDGKSYVITDPEIVAKAKTLFVAQGDIGQKQAALGKEQAELGRKQGLLAQLQAQAASQVQIPDISKAIAEVQRSVQTLSRESAQQSTEQKLNELEARLGQMDEQLARMHEQLAQAHEQAGRNADALGHQQDELGRQQDELGRRQDELGREQERAAHETGRKVRAIIDQSFNAGKARPVD